MNRSSNTPSSYLRQAAFCSAVVLGTLVLGALNQAAAALPCGAPPDVEPAATAPTIKQEIEAKATALLQPPPKANLRLLISTARKELRLKFTDANKQEIDRYLLWATCRDISDNPDLAPTQKFDQYAEYYRMISEPIALASPGATLAFNQPRSAIPYFPIMNEVTQPRRS